MELSRRDFLILGAATAASVGGVGLLGRFGRAPLDHQSWAGKTVGAVQRIPSMCQGCTTACGVIATVKDGRLLSIFGNPEDPFLYANDAPPAVVQEFLSQHVLPWAPAGLTQVESVTAYQLYRTAARLGAALLSEERASAEAEGHGL